MSESISAYEQVTRTRLESLEQKFCDFEEMNNNALKEIKDELKAIRQELSTRLPTWVAAVFTLGGGLIGWLLTIAFHAR